MAAGRDALGRRRWYAFVGVLLAALLCVGSAAAGVPGRWDVVARGPGVPGNSASDVGVARTGSGTLHVAWKERTSATAEALRHRLITAAGRPGLSSTIVSDWAGLSDPDLVRVSGGFRAFFGGQRTVDSTEPLFGLLSSRVLLSGGSWAPPTLIHNRNVAYSRTPSVTVAADGTPFQAWQGGTGIYLHRGLGPAEPDHSFTAGASLSEFGPTVVMDAGPRVWLGWCAFGANGGGVYVQAADAATGAPIGTARKLPASSTTFGGKQVSTCNLERTAARRTPMVARVGGGVYVAGSTGYPTLTRVNVWRIPAGGQPPAGSFAVAQGAFGHVTPVLAAAPDGRIWVAWIELRPGNATVVARRTNRQGTIFGEQVRASAPRGWALGAINVDAQAGRLDVLGLLATPSNDHSIQHTQLLPGLSLRRVRTVRRSAGGAAVTFRVLDAGDPVRRARVSVAGRNATTSANGTVTIVVRPSSPRRLRATATRAGYVGAAVSFRCC